MTDQEQTEAGVLKIVSDVLIRVQILGVSGDTKQRRYIEWIGNVPSSYGTRSDRSLYAFQIAWDMLQLDLLGDRATRAEVYEIWESSKTPVVGDHPSGWIGRVKRSWQRPTR